jgi:lysozyme family protein
MARSSYDESLRRLLAHEGGYNNHPSDPGGPTNFGITIHDYRRYVKPGATAADVRSMRLDEAKRIYRETYWNALRCDDLPAGLDYAVFDYGVNSGIGRSGKVLRRVVGLPADTHAVTRQVLDAVARRDPRTLIAAICDERLRFLMSLKTWPVFGKGWGRRVREVRAAALAMASGSPVARGDTNECAPGKGKVLVNGAAQTATAGGACAAGTAAAAHSNDLWIAVAILVLTIVLAIGGWLFWRWWQRRRQEAVA